MKKTITKLTTTICTVAFMVIFATNARGQTPSNTFVMTNIGSNSAQAYTTWSFPINAPSVPNLPDSINVTFSSLYSPSNTFAASPATYTYYGASAANGNATYQMGGLNPNSYIKLTVRYDVWYPADANHAFPWEQVWQDTSLSFTTTCTGSNLIVSANLTTVCSGSPLTLTAYGNVGNVTWTSSNGGSWTGTAVTVYPVQTGSVTYTATDMNGNCTGTASTIVTVNSSSNISASLSANNVCSGSSVTVTAGGGSNYQWSFPGYNSGSGNTYTFNPTASVTGTLTGLNNCGSLVSIPVTVNVISSNSLIVTSNFTICQGGSGVLSVSGGSGNYSWVGGGNTFSGSTVTVSPLLPTTYTVTDLSNSCGGAQTVFVNVINNTVTLNLMASAQNICSGDMVTITETNGYNAYWVDNGGNSYGNGSTINCNPTTTTTYYANYNGTCGTVTSSTTINVLQSSVLNLVAPSTACVGSSITLSVSGGNGNYTWVGDGLISTTGSTVTAIPTTGNPNSFYTVSSYGGCTSSASISIAVNGAQGSVSLTSNIYNICHNSNNDVILTGTPAGGTFIGNGVNFLVNYPGYSEAIFNPDQAGGNGPITLSYVLNSGNVCSSQDNVIVNVLPSPAGTDYWYISGNGGGQFVLNGQGFPHCTVRIGSYTYVPTTQSSSQIVLDNLPTDVNLVEGLFFTIVPDDPNECSFTFQIVFTIGIKEISAGSSNGNVVTSSMFDDLLKVKLHSGNWKVSLSDIRGREIKKFSVDGNFELKNEGFMSGTYFLSITDGEHTNIVKLLKQ